MTNILSAHTRVNVAYNGETMEGVVTDKSTKDFAHVMLLDLPKRVVIEVPWSQVVKIEYRCFKVEETEDTVTITEIAPKNTNWMNWMGFGELSREGAWAFAGARGKQTVFVSREGESKDLGRHFDPRAFERAAYQGYVSYGTSMTDGYYAPEHFDSWVKTFRVRAMHLLSHNNDAAESVKAALPQYMVALASVR